MNIFDRWEADPNCNGPFPIVFTSVEKTLNNHRAMKFRKAPKQCTEIESVFEDADMRATFCNSFHREKFCLYDTTYCCNDFSYCIYSSKKTIDLITQNVPQEERVLLMDATFSIAPNRMFYQVLIIYVRYFEKVRFGKIIFFLILKLMLSFVHVEGISACLYYDDEKDTKSI